MKKHILLILLLASIMLPLMAAAAPGQIAYLYVQFSRIDPNIVQAFEDQGLSVVPIIYSAVPSTDFSQYEAIFVGSENFPNHDQIPANDFNLILTNRYDAPVWGYADSISVVTSSQALRGRVEKNNSITTGLNLFDTFDVYTAAKDSYGINIQGFYIYRLNRPSSEVIDISVAVNNFGPFDAFVSHFPKGSTLIGGKKENARACFYGIQDSDFWTPASEILIRNCIGYAVFGDDKDGDGFREDVDCNDNNATIHPNATELDDNIDQNCVNDPPILTFPDLTLEEDIPIRNRNLLPYVNDVDDVEANMTWSFQPVTNLSFAVNAPFLDVFPAADYFGVQQGRVTVSDHKNATSQNFTITVLPVNDVPFFSPPLAAKTATEDTLFTYSIHCDDKEQQPITYSDASPLFTINPATGQISFTPTNSDVGIHTVAVSCADGANQTTGIFQLTIQNVNDIPTLNQSIPNQTWPEDTLRSINLSNYFSDQDQDPLVYSVVGAMPQNITVTITGSIVTFAPGLNFFGDRTVRFLANDNHGGQVQSNLVGLSVTPVNDAPTISLPAVTTPEDTPKTIDLLLYTFDVEHDPITFSVIAQDIAKAACQAAGSSLTITPAPEYNGPAGCTIRASDGMAFADGLLNITITPVNDGPILNQNIPDQTFPEDTTKNLDLTPYFSDIDNPILAYTVQGNVHVHFIFAGNTATLSADQDFSGSEAVRITASDGTLSATSNFFQVIVTPVDDVPILQPLPNITQPAGSLVTIHASAFDADNDPLTFSISDARFSVSNDTFTYQSQPQESGTWQITVSVTDAHSVVSKSFTLTLTPKIVLNEFVVDPQQDWDNDSIINADDQWIEIYNNNSFPISIEGWKVELIDPSPGTETLSGSIAPEGYIIIQNPVGAQAATSGQMQLVSDTGFVVDQVTYGTWFDGNISDNAPFGNATGLEDECEARFPNGKDTGVDKDDWIKRACTQGKSNNLDMNPPKVTLISPPDGAIIPLPAETFTFNATASAGLSNCSLYTSITGTFMKEQTILLLGINSTEGSFTRQDIPDNINFIWGVSCITLAGVEGSANHSASVHINDQPILTLDNVTLPEDTNTTINLTDHAQDPDNDSLIFNVTQQTPGVNCTIAGDILSIDPGDDFNGEGSCTITVSDPETTSPPEVIIITVTPVNDAPIMQDIPDQTIFEDQAYLYDVNASDIDSPVLTFSDDSPFFAIDQEAGIISFTPDDADVGVHSIIITVSDGELNDSDSFTLTIINVNDPPIYNRTARYEIDEDTPESFNITQDIIDPDSSSFIYGIVQENISQVDCSIVGELILLSPAQDYFGNAACSISIIDGADSVQATVPIHVNEINDPPVLVQPIPDQVMDEDTTSLLDLNNHFIDVDDPVLVYTSTDTASATITIIGSSVSVTPAQDFFGTFTVTYFANDTRGGFTPSNVVVYNVTAVNDAPIFNLTTITTQEDTPVAVDLDDYTSDVENDPITYTVTGEENATCSLNGSLLTVTPPLDFSGTGECSLQINDPENTLVETIAIIITPVNDAPRATLIPPIILSEDTTITQNLSNFFSDPENDPLTFTHTAAENITITIAGSSATFTPNPDFFGDSSVVFTASDGQLSTDSNTVQITVTPVNDAPIIISVPITIATQDLLYTYDVDATDVDNAVLVYTLTQQPAGMAIDSLTGIITWTPANTDVGQHQVEIVVSDGFLTDTQGYTITVQNVNDAPVFNASNPIPDQTTDEDTPFTINLAGHFSDPDNDPLTYTANNAAHLTVSINGNIATITPEQDFFGVDYLLFTAHDPAGLTADSNNVTVTVNPVNDAPIITSVPITTATQDLLYTYDIDATDIDSVLLTYLLTQAPAGMTIDNGTGLISWTPTNADVGQHTIGIIVTDGLLNATQAYTLIVQNVNDAPVFNASNPIPDQTTDEDTPFTINLAGHFSDPDNDPLTYTANNAAHLTITINGALATITPNLNFNGIDYLIFTAHDPAGLSADSNNVTVTVNPVNDKPIIDVPNQVINEDDTIMVNLTAYSSDVENDLLTYEITAKDMSKAECTVAGSTLTITGAQNFFGISSCTIIAHDGSDNSSADSFMITIFPVNDAPIIQPIPNTTIPEDAPFTLRVNATDVDGDSVTYADNTSLFAINPVTGVISFTPRQPDIGSHDIRISASDGQLSSSTVFTLTITNTNDVPTLSIPDQYFDEDMNKTINLDLYSFDEDGDFLTYSVVNDDPAKVDCEIIQPNLLMITAQNFFGSSSCTILAHDGQADSLPASFNIHINPVNDAPIIQPIPDMTIPEDFLFMYDVNATDPDGDSLTFSDNTSLFAINQQTGVFSFTPTQDDVGPHDIKITVSDGRAQSLASFTLTVINTNDRPTIDVPDQQLTEDTPLSINISQSAFDQDNDPLMFIITATNAAKVDCTIAGDILTMTPALDFHGATACSIVADDGQLNSTVDSFQITVSNINDAPVFNASNPIPNQTTDEDTPFTINLAGHFSDPDNDPLTFTANNAAHLTVSINGNIATITPEQDFFGVDYLIFTAHDPSGLSADSNNITVTVNPVNDAPVIITAPITTATQSQLYTYDVNATDVDSPVLTYSRTVGPTGLIINSATGIISWTPTEQQIGQHQVEIVVSDGFLADTQDYTITVQNVNDAPVFNASHPIPNHTTFEDTPFEIHLDHHFYDPDNDPLTYTANNAAHLTVTFNGATATVTPEQDFFGVDYLIFTAHDPSGLSADSNNVTVTVLPVNDLPNITTQPPADDVSVGHSFVYDVNATDVDSPVLTFSLPVSPGGMTINPVTGIISWTPGDSDIGTNSVQVLVDDNDGGSDNQSFALIVHPVNRPPMFNASNPIPNQTTLEDTPFTLDLAPYFRDPDNDTLTFASTGETDMTITFAGSIATISPDQDFNGENQVTFSASDSQYTAFSNLVTITVLPVNDPPVIITAPLTTASQGVLYVYDVNATDVENDPITYSLVNKPAGMVIGSITGVITWTPTNADVGLHGVTVEADDNHGASALQAYTISVGNLNDPPILGPIDNITVRAGTFIKINATATDPDNDLLTFHYTAPFNQQGEWQTLLTDKGVFNVTVSVTDGIFTDSQLVIVTVIGENTIPQFGPMRELIIVTAGETVTIPVDVLDQDGDPLTVHISEPVGDDGIWVTTDANIGRHEVLVTATDGVHTIVKEILIIVLERPSEDLRITRTAQTKEYVKAGEGFVTFITAENFGTMDSKNVHFSAVIMELGTKAHTERVNIKENHEQTVPLKIAIPRGVPPGQYTIRITVSDDALRRVIHRDIIVTK